jgi:hypothetical protein
MNDAARAKKQTPPAGNKHKPNDDKHGLSGIDHGPVGRTPGAALQSRGMVLKQHE